MKKFKLTKESLAELAKVMPQLSEEEQRDCVGGKVVIVDQNGNLVRGNNQIINDYQAREQDTEHVYWYVTGDDGKVLNSIMSNGSVSSSNNNGSVKDMDMEGTAVNKNVMKFLSSSTSVEWGMALREEESNSGFYGRISTSDNCDLSSDSYTGYTEWYHSHPLDEKERARNLVQVQGIMK